MKFLDGLDNDLKIALLSQLRDLWTHNSTALEGNTLTLGETAFVLSEGLTVSGKSLREHQEIAGHAYAIELLYQILKNNKPVTESDLFTLHKAIQTSIVIDIFQPIGAWKNEPNGTYALTPGGKQTFIDYAMPCDVPPLMKKWLGLLNSTLDKELTQQELVKAYCELHLSFVRIHPFADGNGRMARLIANLPVLKVGLPPILIDTTRRREYLSCLSSYDIAVGTIISESEIIPTGVHFENFMSFCQSCWQLSISLVDEMKQRQSERLLNFKKCFS